MDYDKQILQLNAQKKQLKKDTERKKKNIDLQINYLRKRKLDQQRQELTNKK